MVKVNRLLQKSPDDRYQSARDVVADLQTLQETGVVRVQQPRTLSRRAAAFAAVVAIAAIAGGWWGVQRLRSSAASPPTLVVVPATVTGPAQFQYLTDAIPASLTARLTVERGLRMKLPPSSAESLEADCHMAPR